jgi:hypothetical protein
LTQEEQVLFNAEIEKSRFDDRIPGLIQVRVVHSPLCFSIWKSWLLQYTNFNVFVQIYSLCSISRG